MAEICAHIKATKGCALYCCGGLHTRETLALCIEEIIEGINEHLPEVPDTWVQWPCTSYFFTDALENHWKELLVLGNMDNESIHLQVSFADKVSKLRELFVNEFTSEAEYRKVAKLCRAGKAAPTARMTAFNEDAQAAINVKVGQFGHFRSLVAVSEESFDMIWRIITRDYPAAKGISDDPDRKLSGGGRSVREIKNPQPLFEFMNLPDETLQEILSSILDGTVDINTARKDAKEMKAGARMAKAFESRFNELGGIRGRGAHKKPGYVKFGKVLEKLPHLKDESHLFMSLFEKTANLKLDAKRQFDGYVDTAFNLYQKQGKVVVGSKMPRQFKNLLNEAQKKVSLAEAKFKLIQAPEGVSATLVINDRTENLEIYLQRKSCKFGTSIVCF